MTSDERGQRGAPLRWTWVALGLCVTLRLPFVGVPLNVDEGGDAMIARAWAHTHGSIYGQYWLDRPPVMLLLYRTGLIGGDIGVRLLGMVAALLLVLGCIVVARRLAGATTAALAGCIAATMTGSMITGSALTDAELLACVPAVYSVAALLVARESAHAPRWFAIAGVLAGTSVMIKQSFMDALAAGCVMLVALALARRSSGFRVTWPVAYIVGAMVPPALCVGWAWKWSSGVRPFLYAVWGFRVDAAAAQQRLAHPAVVTLETALVFAVVSGAAVLLPWATWQIVRNVRSQQRVLAATMTAWLVAGIVGVIAGRNFFGHYFIQLVPVCAVLGGAGIAACTGRLRWLAWTSIASVVALAAVNFIGGTYLLHVAPPQKRVQTIATYLDRNANPHDTVYVLYARANLAGATKLTAPFPYEWSLMMETMPSAERQLRTWLAGPQRPTWIVEWQQPTSFGLDRSGDTRALLAKYYRYSASVCGKPVLRRIDQPRAGRPIADSHCPGHAPFLSSSTLDGVWA